ncbi:MAG: phytase [Fimbriimonas sp.]
MLFLATLLLVDVKPAFATQPVGTDADDPAIWVHPTRPERSRILGTDKTEAPRGGLVVFDLKGRIVQRIGGLDRPNNVDVEGDLAVVTERKKERLRIFRIDRNSGKLTDVTGETRVFEGETGEDAAPMGVGLYRRPSDGVVFAIVTPKAGPREGHLAQYRLHLNPRSQRYDAHLVRRFGKYSGVKETESVFVDDTLGYVYYSDETVGTRKYHADPMAPNADRELGFFNRQGGKGDHEGIALWAKRDGTGFLVCTDQREGNSVYRVFRREDDNAFVGEFRGGADETDGIDMTSIPLGPRFPKGLFVAMNSGPKNFLVFDARSILKGLR